MAVVDASGGESGVECEADAVFLTEAFEFVLHAWFENAAEEIGDVRAEGLCGGTEKTGAGAVANLRAALHEVNECWGWVIAAAE